MREPRVCAYLANRNKRSTLFFAILESDFMSTRARFKVQTRRDMTDHMDPVLREAIDLFKSWSKDKIYFNGIAKNANKMAHILPLFQGFVMDHADFWESHYGYKMRGDKPGPLSKIYPLFRDHILVVALTEMLADIAEKYNVSPEELPAVSSPLRPWRRTLNLGPSVDLGPTGTEGARMQSAQSRSLQSTP